MYYTYIYVFNARDNFVPVQDTKIYRKNGGTAPLVLNLRTNGYKW